MLLFPDTLYLLEEIMLLDAALLVFIVLLVIDNVLLG
ncbi:hypothetical protein HNR37_001587 [Desulfurispira natronophila]|uniref:Uncharacterized protein n=1 Tax=Desulfurispira natronophila TaxID=682562 RepID=A0A7W7Y541_9BACT|nr:hypothetical protein [Desulfurispira natronophila]